MIHLSVSLCSVLLALIPLVGCAEGEGQQADIFTR